MRDTRAQLLDEAEILIRSRGYSGFSYADLSTAVGIRKASIHHHFPSKTDLAVALLDAYRARYAQWPRRDHGGDRRRDRPHRRLCRLLPPGGRERSRLPRRRAGRRIGDPARPAARRTSPASSRPTVAWLERVLRQGQANGTIRAGLEPAPAARMIIATLEGALMMERVAAGPDGFKGMLSALRASLR